MLKAPEPGSAPQDPLPALAGWLLVFADGQRQPLTLVVLGEADLATAGQLRHALLEAVASTPVAVVVDLAGLEFCDLPGLDALHDGLDAAQAARVPMTVRGMSAQVAWLHRTFPRRRPRRRGKATTVSVAGVSVDSAANRKEKPEGSRSENGQARR